MGLTIVTPASTSPIDDAEVKAICAIEDASFDTLLALLKPAAVRQIEEILGRPLAATGYRLTLDAFSDTIELPRGPALGVSSIKYFDASNTQITLDQAVYSLDLVSDPAWVVRNSDSAWPDVMDAINVVQVNFTAGYDASGVALPASLKLAVGALVKHWFENGADAGVPDGVMNLLEAFRTSWIVA